MTYRDDDEVMKYLYPSAGNIGDIPSFWKTLDSVQFTDFVFSKLTSYTLVRKANSRTPRSQPWCV